MTSAAVQPPSTQIQRAVHKPLATLEGLLDQQRPKLAQLLPRHLSPERFIRISLAAAARNPSLLKCTPSSFLLAVAQAAELGLEPSGFAGGCDLIPRKNQSGAIEAHCEPNVKGLMDLARRTGQVLSIRSNPVYSRDVFEYVDGIEPVLRHVPVLAGDRGSLVNVYAIAHLKGGGTQIVVMTREDVERVRKSSRAKKGSPWDTHPDRMWVKTAVKRLCRYLPQTNAMAMALDMAESHEELQAPETSIEEEPAIEVESRTAAAALADTVEAQQDAPGDANDDYDQSVPEDP